MHQRLLLKNLSKNRPFLLVGAKGVGKTTLALAFSVGFSNTVHLNLDTEVDRAIFNLNTSYQETLKAISFLKGIEIRGKGTLIILDEVGHCEGALHWLRAQAGGRVRGPGQDPVVVAISSVMTQELEELTHADHGVLQKQILGPFSFEEFLMAMEDPAALEAFREVPVPYYAYEKLLSYFHQYSLVGGMPEIVVEYANNLHLLGLKYWYEKIGDRFSQIIREITAGQKSNALTMDVLMNAYPFAATRVSFNHFGNLEKGSREVGQAFRLLEKAFLVKLILPVTSAMMPVTPDRQKFPRLQLVDTGLVNYFSGIQKPLFHSHDMNSIFEGQIARQVVGQEILTASRLKKIPKEILDTHDSDVDQELNFWIRNKAQSSAEVDFVLPYDGMLIPVVVRSGEPGRLRSLHQFIDQSSHPFAVRLYAEKLAVQQTRTIQGKPFFLLNLPYFLAGKIQEYMAGFIRLAKGK